jgi:hypothetical protein
LWLEVQLAVPYYLAQSLGNPWSSFPSSRTTSAHRNPASAGGSSSRSTQPSVADRLIVEMQRERALRLQQELEYAAAATADLHRQQERVRLLVVERDEGDREAARQAAWRAMDEPGEEDEGVITLLLRFKVVPRDMPADNARTAPSSSSSSSTSAATAAAVSSGTRVSRRFLASDPAPSLLDFVERHPLCPLNVSYIEVTSSYPRIVLRRQAGADEGGTGTLKDLGLISQCVLWVHIQL